MTLRGACLHAKLVVIEYEHAVRILVGSAIIVLAGLFIFHRQKVVDEVPPENVPKGVN